MNTKTLEVPAPLTQEEVSLGVPASEIYRYITLGSQPPAFIQSRRGDSVPFLPSDLFLSPHLPFSLVVSPSPGWAPVGPIMHLLAFLC